VEQAGRAVAIPDAVVIISPRGSIPASAGRRRTACLAWRRDRIPVPSAPPLLNPNRNENLTKRSKQNYALKISIIRD
jgi:hypothetical protein